MTADGGPLGPGWKSVFDFDSYSIWIWDDFRDCLVDRFATSDRPVVIDRLGVHLFRNKSDESCIYLFKHVLGNNSSNKIFFHHFPKRWKYAVNPSGPGAFSSFTEKRAALISSSVIGGDSDWFSERRNSRGKWKRLGSYSSSRGSPNWFLKLTNQAFFMSLWAENEFPFFIFWCDYLTGPYSLHLVVKESCVWLSLQGSANWCDIFVLLAFIAFERWCWAWISFWITKR